MYQKYTTEAFIVSTRVSGENDRLFLIYTREFGMIMAHATSVRASKSKLRPHLNIGVLLTLTLLKSKIRWTLTEATESTEKIYVRSLEYKVFAKILLALKSLIHGEEKNESLFEVLLSFYNFLLEKHDDEKLISGAECLTMVQILNALGYGKSETDILQVKNDFTDENLLLINQNRKELVKEINRALGETGF